MILKIEILNMNWNLDCLNILKIRIYFLIIVPDVCGLRNSLQVELLQDQTHLMLQEYCNSKGQLSTGKLRFGKILLTMPIISQVCYT